MRHGAEPALLQRQARLGAIKSLDLALLVERQHDRVGRRLDIEADHVAQLVDEVGSFESLNCRSRCGWRPCAFQMRRTALALMPLARPSARLSSGSSHPADPHASASPRERPTPGPAQGCATARLVAQQAVDAFVHEPLLPAPHARLRVPVRRMISLVPIPSALRRRSPRAKRASARRYGTWRSLQDARRPRNVMKIPLRMHQTRTARNRESQSDSLSGRDH